MMIHSSDIFSESWPRLTEIYEENEAKSLIKWLMEDLWGITTTDLFLNKTISSEKTSLFDQYIDQLLEGIPIQHILGYAWFMNEKFYVNSNVLIPRQETEELVQLVIEQNPGFSGSILDIGTGTGIIPISINRSLPEAQVTGLDVSAKALSIARKNAQSHSANISWIKMNILKDYPDTHYDMLISNPPYVLQSDKQKMHQNVLGKDPDLALFVDDEEPLIFYQRICELSSTLLKPSGRVYFEIHEAYGAEVKQLMKQHHYSEVTIFKDLNGKDRMAVGTKKAGSL